MMQNCFYKNVNKGVGRFFAHEVLMPGGSGWRSPGPMRESFFAQGRAYTELRRIEQFCETGNFDAIPTALTSNSQLSIAVANGILPRARQKRYAQVEFIYSIVTKD